MGNDRNDDVKTRYKCGKFPLLMCFIPTIFIAATLRSVVVQEIPCKLKLKNNFCYKTRGFLKIVEEQNNMH